MTETVRHQKGLCLVLALLEDGEGETELLIAFLGFWRKMIESIHYP